MLLTSRRDYFGCVEGAAWQRLRRRVVVVGVVRLRPWGTGAVEMKALDCMNRDALRAREVRARTETRRWRSGALTARRYMALTWIDS